MQTSSTGIPHGGSPVVLRACLVNDHPTVREWLTGKLDGLGIDVCAVSDTLAGGLEVILTHQPDLAVVDNRLPDGRGIDLCRQVRGALPGLGLILHTGVISPLEEQQAYDSGVSRIALKSIHGDDLVAAVAEIAALRRLRR